MTRLGRRGWCGGCVGGDTVAEGAAELRGIAGAADSPDGESVRDGVEQLGGAFDEFDFPFPPLLAERAGGEAVGLDAVVADLGEHGAVVAAEHVHDPVIAQPHDRHEHPVAHVDAYPLLEAGRHELGVGAERLVHLAAFVRAATLDPGRELQVPAGVVPAGAAPQGDPVCGKGEVGRVEVDGVERLFDGGVHPGHAGQVLQRRQNGCRVDFVFAFDLCEIHGIHARQCTPGRRSAPATAVPVGAPEDVLTRFVNAQGDALGRPVGVALDRAGALLVADDVGNVIWRVKPAASKQ